MKLVALKDVCRITNGGTPKSGVSDFWHGDVAWLTPAEMGKRKTPEISETARTISQAGLANSSAKLVPANSVILSTRAPIGHLAINQEPMAFNQGCRGLTPDDRLDTKFLYYFLYFSREALDELGTGTTFKELSSSNLTNFQIPLFSLDEQRRIVAELDKSFAAIAIATANAQKNRSNARTLFDGHLESLFIKKGEDWQERTLADVCEKITDGTHQTPKYFDQGYVFLSSRNVKNRVIDWDNIKYVDEAQHLAMQKRLQPRVGDILLAKNGTTGVAAMVDRDLVFDIYVSLALLRPKPGLSPEFLLHFVNSPIAKRQFNKRLKGTGVPNLHLEEIREVSISFPRFSEDQQAVVDQLDRLLKHVLNLEGNFSRKLAALAELKQSLLQKAFAGESTTAIAEPTAPAANDNFATAKGTAQIIAFAHRRHEQKHKQRTFGHVKAQKALHLIESVGSIDLGRRPIKDSAGPNDMQHMLRATDWAVQQSFFEFVPRANGNGYEFRKLANYDACWSETEAATNPVAVELARAIDLIVGSDSDFAELIATTHAAWNNLIIDKAEITDDAIVLASRDNWHASKLRHDPSRFHDAIRFIKANGIVPEGSAKYVGGQVSLF